MQMTAASSPSMQIQMGICGGQRVIFLLLSPGIQQPSSSKTKWALPMMTFLFSTILEMPWATTYCTCEWYSSWVRPRRFASSTTALAIEWDSVPQTGGEAEHIHFPVSAEGNDLRHLRRGVGQRTGLVEHNGIRLGHSLQKTPALDGNVVPAAFPHGRQHATGIASFSAQENPTIKTASILVTSRVSR